MKFSKMHGLGNDFIVIDAREKPDLDYNALAKQWCDRHTGIGADGLLLVLDSEVADTRMRIINADGSEAEMCGNGIRCFAKFVFDRGIVKKSAFSIETYGGIMRPRLLVVDGAVDEVCVDMGEPLFDSADIPVLGEGRCIERTLTVDGKEYVFTSMRIGVPHTVVFVDDLDSTDIEHLGNLIEHADIFPQRTNVNFLEPVSDRAVKVRTWERGCGCTLACGTGSTSAAVACALTGRTGRSVDVFIALGRLHIDWAADNHVYMTGPAAYAFKGEV